VEDAVRGFLKRRHCFHDPVCAFRASIVNGIDRDTGLFSSYLLIKGSPGLEMQVAELVKMTPFQANRVRVCQAR
jgi:hypothetical protein